MIHCLTPAKTKGQGFKAFVSLSFRNRLLITEARLPATAFSVRRQFLMLKERLLQKPRDLRIITRVSGPLTAQITTN